MSGSTSHSSNDKFSFTKLRAHAQKMFHVFSLNNEFSQNRRHINSGFYLHKGFLYNIKKGLFGFPPNIEFLLHTKHTLTGFSPYSKTSILLIWRKVLKKQPYSRCLKNEYNKKHFTLLEMYPCRYTVIWSSLHSALHTNV